MDHYAILNVDPGASPTEVRRAYRKQAKKLHPDANNSNEATRQFQHLQNAYRVLQNPRLRLAYDASRFSVPQTQVTFPEFGARPNTRPFICGSCKRPTAQPRYAIYWSVVSNLVYAIRTADMGMFCAGCARKAGLRASLISALFGWWSLPGLVLTPLAIFGNARGGERLPGADSLLLWHSALLFYAKGDARMAHGLAKQVVERGDLHSNFARNMMTFLKYLRPHEKGSIKDAWAAQRLDGWKHLLLGLAAPSAIAAVAVCSDINFSSIAADALDAGNRLSGVILNRFHGD